MSMITKTIKVEGMSCSHCEKAVKEAVLELAGVEKVEVSLENKSVTIELDEGSVTEEAIKDAIEDAGYDVVL